MSSFDPISAISRTFSWLFASSVIFILLSLYWRYQLRKAKLSISIYWEYTELTIYVTNAGEVPACLTGLIWKDRKIDMIVPTIRFPISDLYQSHRIRDMSEHYLAAGETLTLFQLKLQQPEEFENPEWKLCFNAVRSQLEGTHITILHYSMPGVPFLSQTKYYIPKRFDLGAPIAPPPFSQN